MNFYLVHAQSPGMSCPCNDHTLSLKQEHEVSEPLGFHSLLLLVLCSRVHSLSGSPVHSHVHLFNCPFAQSFVGSFIYNSQQIGTRN